MILTLKRKKQYDNALRSYKIYLDEKLVRSLTSNESIKLELAEGKHQLVAKIDWCSSNILEIDTKEGEECTVEVSGVRLARWMLLCGVLPMLVFYGLNYVFKLSLFYFFVPFVFVFAFVVYSITIGRKQYLRLKKVE